MTLRKMKQESKFHVSELKTPAYIVDAKKFQKNLCDLRNAFKKIYPNFHIGYSYKTNYVQKYTDMVVYEKEFSEVVSHDEYMMAKVRGVRDDMIIYNGVIDDFVTKLRIAKHGGIVNIDNLCEFKKFVAVSNNEAPLEIGVRLNFDIGNGVDSRFGIDVESEDFEWIANKYNHPYVKIKCVHFHVGEGRDLQSFRRRILGLIKYANILEADILDIGGNMCGPMYHEYKAQFGFHIPTFDEYAQVVAGEMKKAYPNCDKMLITENGTSLVADTMHLLTSVIGVKKIRNHTYITLDTKMQDVGSSCVHKSPAYKHIGNCGNEVQDGILVGSTCLDIDRIVKDYKGPANIGDKILLKGVGAYSNNCSSNWIVNKVSRYYNIEDFYL